LLLHGDGTNGSTTITDSSPSPKTVTAVGNAQINTTVTDPFGRTGAGVLAFDGTGDYLTISSGLPQGTEDFTIEWWENLAATNVNCPVFRFSVESRSGIKTGNGVIQFFIAITNSINVGYTYVTTAGWQHIAITRSSGVVRMFASGVLLTNAIANDFQSVSIPVSLDSFIGRAWTDFYTLDFSGYLDDIRITRGIARYTANFTPPTAPFPDI
jgi:hypothetical protein